MCRCFELVRRSVVPRVATMAAVAICLASTSACKEDACKGRPTEIEIEVQPDDNLLAQNPSFVRVTITLNDKVVVSREFSTPAPRFVFEPRETDAEPRSITISAIAYADADNALGSGRVEATFSPDGCNFVTLPVAGDTSPLDASDASDLNDAGIEDADAASDGPHADACNSPCGDECCTSDELCIDQARCGHPGTGRTVVFATVGQHRADMDGRTGSANICQADKPDELACSVVQALLTVSRNDQLRDMPQQYGFNARDALYFFHQSGRHLTWFAASWDEALDTETPLGVSARTGTGVTSWSQTDGFWTGSKHDGTYDTDSAYDYTCERWTCRDGSGPGCQQTLGAQGDPTVLDLWLHSSWNYISCGRSLYLLCACRLE